MKLNKIAQELGLPPGYDLSVTRGCHIAIHRPDGTPLRSASGQALRVSATPSDRRSRRNEAARIRKAIRAGEAS